MGTDLLAAYLNDYLNEELTRGSKITRRVINDGIEAFCAGANYTGDLYEVNVKIKETQDEAKVGSVL